jgi:hypothetical protein
VRVEDPERYDDEEGLPQEVRPVLTLVGRDGNAVSIVGRTARALRRAGFTKKKIDEYRRRALSGDYNNVLTVTLEYIEEGSSDDYF